MTAARFPTTTSSARCRVAPVSSRWGPIPQFDLLYIPPLTRDQDLGMSTLLVAARFCRERRALQIVDPPQVWAQPQEALDGLAAWPFRSDNAAMFFPRVLALDRLRNRMPDFAPGAAAAGMLARSHYAGVLPAQPGIGGGAASDAAPGRCPRSRAQRAARAGRHQYPGAAAPRPGAPRAQLHAGLRGFRPPPTGITWLRTAWRCSWPTASSAARAGC